MPPGLQAYLALTELAETGHTKFDNGKEWLGEERDPRVGESRRYSRNERANDLFIQNVPSKDIKQGRQPCRTRLTMMRAGRPETQACSNPSKQDLEHYGTSSSLRRPLGRCQRGNGSQWMLCTLWPASSYVCKNEQGHHDAGD